MFSLIWAWFINSWVSNREAGDLRRHRAHYDATVICLLLLPYSGLGGRGVFQRFNVALVLLMQW